MANVDKSQPPPRGVPFTPRNTISGASQSFEFRQDPVKKKQIDFQVVEVTNCTALIGFSFRNSFFSILFENVTAITGWAIEGILEQYPPFHLAPEGVSNHLVEM